MSDPAILGARLHAGVLALGALLDDAAQGRLLAYLYLLAKWNQTYNLTAIDDIEAMVARHLLDSLTVLPHLPTADEARLLDVGTGAGLPGMVLAIARPGLHCTLLDSNGKKTRFLTQVAIEMKLANVEVVQARVEAYRPPHGFHCITARAYTDLPALLPACGPLLADRGQVIAMKAARSEAEIAAIPAGWQCSALPVAVPGLKARRVLVFAAPSLPAGQRVLPSN